MYSAIPKKTFLTVDTVNVKHQISFSQISSVLDIPVEDLRYMNPSYKKNVIPVLPEEESYLTLPAGKAGAFITNENKIYNYYKKDTINSRDVLASQEVIKIHTVRSGEHLSTIAKRYGCTVADIKQWNGIKSSTVKPGRKLTIYLYDKKIADKKAAAADAASTVVSSPKENSGAAKYKYYTIKKGDSLYKIAKANNMTTEELKKMNSFGAKFTLIPGKKLKVGVL
jgi:membrane-bound lytic murein transglycosylase D